MIVMIIGYIVVYRLDYEYELAVKNWYPKIQEIEIVGSVTVSFL